MPTIVACPECASKLRVPDNLAGQAVRCARCGTAFTAPIAAPDDASGRPAGAWSEPTKEPSFPAPRTSARPDDINLSLDDYSPAAERPARSADAEQEPPPVRRPALNDEHDDLRRCPHCGKQTHRDYVRCPYCGERLSRRASERRRNSGRRDAEPHRGGMVLTLGVIGLIGMFFCPPVGLVFGIMAWVLGHNDLQKMKDGQMDPEGESSTQGGWICGIIATLLGLLLTLGCSMMFVLMRLANPGM